MWFDKKNRAQRTETLLNEVRFYDPDIVALQEVVPESLEIIIAKMQPTYYIIGVNPSGFPAGYDTLILSKFPPIEWDRYYLPKTKMGRNLLLATLQTQTRQITVGTFHLESVFFPKTKEAEDLKESQLKYIYAISPMNSILMGDTNLPLSKRGIPLPLSKRGIPPNDEPNATPNMIDLGAEDIEFQESDVHSTSQLDVHNLGVCPFSKGAGAPDSSGLGVSPFLKGATYCGRTNKHVKNKSIQSRLDRIYVKIKRNSLKVHFYGLTGTFTQPSDHFGIFAQIEF
jgi:endonuclease/exonuclease/phosphatase family metal-dependent hydrolase